jgi:hypothetical protein
MAIRNSYLAMIKTVGIGWEKMCDAMLMTRSAMENRIYERKGQRVDVELAMAMQGFSGTTLFAEAIAAASGGTFVKLPQLEEIDNEALLVKFNQLHSKIGLLSSRFNEYTADGEIEARERDDMQQIGTEVHRTIQELLAVTFAVYCPVSEPKSKKKAV